MDNYQSKTQLDDFMVKNTVSRRLEGAGMHTVAAHNHTEQLTTLYLPCSSMSPTLSLCIFQWGNEVENATEFSFY